MGDSRGFRREVAGIGAINGDPTAPPRAEYWPLGIPAAVVVLVLTLYLGFVDPPRRGGE